MKLRLSELFRVLALFGGLLAASATTHAESMASCSGSVPNFLTDVCLSCAFPIRLFGSAGLTMGQEDVDTMGGTKLACNCGLKIGVPISFWEPSRIAEVTRTAYCFPVLGGTKISGPGDDMDGGYTRDSMQWAGAMPGVGGPQHDMAASFWHAHWHINPLFVVLGLVVDSDCTENKGWDLAYFTEIDPTWNDLELENVLTPDAVLFGSLPALVACGADCIAASAGMFGDVPLLSDGSDYLTDMLYWCAGCQGGLFPLTGHVESHVGNIQATSLIAQRVVAKLHRAGTQWSAAGTDGMCGYYPELIMRKTRYKYSMQEQTAKIAGRCCQPFGRTTTVWGADKDIPGKEHHVYFIFRKRDCCQGAL